MTRRRRKRFLWAGVLLAALGGVPIAPQSASAGLAAMDAYHVGRYHLANGEREKALEAFDDAVRMNPQFVQAYIARGKLYAEMGRFESALSDLNFAIRIQPTHPEAFAYRGYALLSLGRPQEAMPEFDMALRLDHSYARVYFLRGQALKLLGDDGNAASSIALARRLDPTIEIAQVVTAGADGSMKENFGLVSGEQALGRTPGAGLPADMSAGAAGGVPHGRVIRFNDHPLLSDLQPPRNARPLERPAPHTHAQGMPQQSAGYPQQLGASRPHLPATRAISPAIPDITAVPETPLPASTPANSEGEATPEAAPMLDLVGTEPAANEGGTTSDVTTSEPGTTSESGPSNEPAPVAAANAPARITLSPQTVVTRPGGDGAGAEFPAGELPKIVVIPAPTSVAPDGTLPVVVTPEPATAVATTGPNSVGTANAGSPTLAPPAVDVPHVVTIPAGAVPFGAMPPGAAGIFQVDPSPPLGPSESASAGGSEGTTGPEGTVPAPAVVMIESPADERTGSPTATEILKQHGGADGQGTVGRGEDGLASAVASARSLLPGDAPSLAHVSDDGSSSPTRLATPATATATDEGALSAADESYRQGLAAEEAGDFKTALAAYAEALRLNPSDPLPACRRGHVLCDLGRTAEALAEFDGAIRAAPGFSAGYFGRAHVMYVTDLLEDAVDDYSIALRLDDRHAQALLERGHCYARMGKASEAAADRGAALALDPVLVANGPQYATEVQPRKPLPAGSVIVSDDGGPNAGSTTAGTASAAPTMHPSAFQNLFDGAAPLEKSAAPTVVAAAGRPEGAQPPAAMLPPGMVLPKAATAPPAGVEAAVATVSEGEGRGSAVAIASDDGTVPTEVRPAVGATTTVELAADPALAALNGSSGEGVVPLAADVVGGEVEKGDSGKATIAERDRLTEQLASRPGDAALYVARARQQLGLGDARGALEDVTTALRLNPNLHEAVAVRAETLAATNKFPAAHADYVQLLASDPNDPTLYSGRGYVRLAMGQTAEAIEDFNTALQLDPKKGEVYCQRALAYALAGDQAAALADFDAALNAAPTDAEVFLCRAKVAAEFGDKRQALADLNQAIRLDPKKAEAYFERSRLYAERGAYENAQADRRRALELDPGLR